MANIPECFCNEEAAQACDWVFECEVKYHRENDPGQVRVMVPFKMDKIPQPLAQAMLQHTVNAVNERGVHVYKEWLAACYGDNDPVAQMVEKTLNI